jgi:hypothetical protein
MKTMNRIGSFTLRAGMGCAALAWTLGAGAAELDWSLSAGATHSDNAGRSATDEVSDTRGELGLNLSYARDEGRLNARVDSNLQYRSYFDNSYDDELVGRFNGQASYWFIPERFSWVVEDNFGQTYINRAAVETPANSQNTNYFSTGPDFLLRLGSRTDLSLQGRWSDVSYETSQADSQRLEGTVGLIRRLGERSSLSLNASAASVDVKDAAQGANYDSRSAFLGYEIEGARTQLSLNGGYTEVRRSGETFDGPLVDLSVSRETSARSTLTLRAGTRLSDSADMFRLDQGTGSAGGYGGNPAADPNQDVSVSNEPFQSDYASLTWNLAGERNSFSVSADWRNEDYTVTKLRNRESLGINAILSRQIAASLTGRLFGLWRTEDFANTDINYDEWSYGAGLDWAFARRFSLGLDATRYQGSGDLAAGDGLRDYTENRYSLRVNYYPGR